MLVHVRSSPRVPARLSTSGMLLGVLAILLLPAQLSGQERAGVRAAKTTVTRPQVKMTDFAVQVGAPGDEGRVSQRLTHRDRAVVAHLGRRLRAGATFEDIRPAWTALVRRSRLTDTKDIDELARWVAREGHGEDEELATLSLQETQQRQQQTLQMMSNMQKAGHDAAMNSIRNMKGM